MPYLIDDNGTERIAGINDFESTSIVLSPGELAELRKIFECRTQTAPPTLWRKTEAMRETLQTVVDKLELTPDEWWEMKLFLEWRKMDKPAAFRKCGRTILAKLKANPPVLKCGYTIIKEI